MQLDMQTITPLVIGGLAIWLVWKVIAGAVRLIVVLTIVVVVAMMLMRLF